MRPHKDSAHVLTLLDHINRICSFLRPIWHMVCQTTGGTLREVMPLAPYARPGGLIKTPFCKCKYSIRGQPQSLC